MAENDEIKRLGKSRLWYSSGGFIDGFIFLGMGMMLPTAVVMALGGGDHHIGILGAAAYGLFSLFQFFGPVILKLTNSNRRGMLLLILTTAILMLGQSVAIVSRIFFSTPGFALYSYIVLFYIMTFMGGPKQNIEASWAGDLVPTKKLGWFNSLKWIFVNVGNMLGVFLIARFIDTFHYIKGFFVLYILLAIVLALSLFFYGRVEDKKPQNLKFIKDSDGNRDRLALRNFALWCYIAFYLIWAGGRTIMYTFYPKFLMEELQFNLTDIAGIETIRIVVSCLALYVFGKVCDIKGNRLITMVVSLIMAFCMYLWVATAWFGTKSVIIFAIVNGAAGMTHSMLGINLALEIFPGKGRAFYLAFARFFIGAAGVITPIIAGFTMRAFHDVEFTLFGATLMRYHLVFFAAATMTVCCAIPLILMGNRKVEA
jgi:MFS family permease